MNTQLEVPYGEMVEKLWKHEELPDMYHHCAVGIVGEVIELYEAERKYQNGFLTFEHVLEELGDLVFFTTRAALWEGAKLESFEEVPKEMDADLLFTSGELMDVSKRFKVYSKPLETDRWNRNLNLFIPCLYAKFRLHGTTLEEVQLANQRKLLTGEKARYKLGLFSAEQAQARADKG